MSALIVLAAFSVFVGALIGAAGIGGVLLVPFMAYGVGLDVHNAISGAMFGYIFAGAVGAFLYARHGSIRWRVAAWIILGAMIVAAFAEDDDGNVRTRTDDAIEVHQTRVVLN